MTDPLPPPATIFRLFDAVYPPFALLAGMELDLFTPLKDGPLPGEQLAETLGVQAGKLGPLLYALVVAGLLTVEGDRFNNTPEAAHFLVRGEPAYLGGMRHLVASNWERVLKTSATVRDGAPPQKHDYVVVPHDEQVAFFRGLYPGAVADARRLMEHFDFSTCETLLDVGGGSGALAITLAQANPQLKATVSDLPSVTPVTQHFVAEADLADRMEIVASDAVRETLSGSFDVVVARHLVQVLSVDDCRALLRNLAAVLNPGGVLHIVGWMLDDSRISPEKTVGYNLILLNAYDDGQAYTEQEQGEWLAEAGLVDFERVVFPDGASILTGHKPA